MKTIFALMIGLAVGFFFGRAGTVQVRTPPLGVAAPAATAPSAPLPSPMSNPGPRPTWKARIEPASEAIDRRRCLEGLSDAEIDEWRRSRPGSPAK